MTMDAAAKATDSTIRGFARAGKVSALMPSPSLGAKS